MKRIVCVFLAVCLCIALTACGDPTPEKITEETVKIVLVCAGDREEETSQAAAYVEQLKTAAQMIGLKKEQYAVCDGVPDTYENAVEKAVISYIRDGYSIVFGAEAGYASAMKKLAAKYPRVTFVQIGDADETLPNYYAYQVKAYEGAYLCGLVAGEFSKSGNLGVLTADTTSVQSHQLANAFLLGAQVRKPNAKVFVAALANGGHSSPLSLLSHKDCDGVLIAVDNKEAVDFAKSGGMRVYTALGRADTDTVTYRVTLQHTNQMVNTFQNVLDKQAPYYSRMHVGYADGFLQCENGYEEDNAQATILSNAAKAVFVQGKWDVFAGVKLAWDGTVQAFAETPTAVKDAEGTIRIPAGAGMPASETLTGMDWFMQGITVIDTGA